MRPAMTRQPEGRAVSPLDHPILGGHVRVHPGLAANSRSRPDVRVHAGPQTVAAAVELKAVTGVVQGRAVGPQGTQARAGPRARGRDAGRQRVGMTRGEETPTAVGSARMNRVRNVVTVKRVHRTGGAKGAGMMTVGARLAEARTGAVEARDQDNPVPELGATESAPAIRGVPRMLVVAIVQRGPDGIVTNVRGGATVTAALPASVATTNPKRGSAETILAAKRAEGTVGVVTRGTCDVSATTVTGEAVLTGRVVRRTSNASPMCHALAWRGRTTSRTHPRALTFGNCPVQFAPSCVR